MRAKLLSAQQGSGAAQEAAPREGLRSPRSTSPAKLVAEPRAPGDTAQDPALPLGQTESERAARTLLLRGAQSCTGSCPTPPEHRGPYRLGDCGSYCWS